MKVGSGRPELRQDWRSRSWGWRRLAECEWLASWFFFLFNSLAILRLALKSVVAVGLIVTVWGVYGEFQQREVDRTVRIATLFAQIAQVYALPDGKGLASVKASVEMLVRERVPVRGIVLDKVDLIESDLSGGDFSFSKLGHAKLARAKLIGAALINTDLRWADLREANLAGARLLNAVLSDANLSGVNLKEASLSLTNLSGARLVNTDLTGADLLQVDLSGAMLIRAVGLSQEQLDAACAETNKRPSIPQGLIWRGTACSNPSIPDR